MNPLHAKHAKHARHPQAALHRHLAMFGAAAVSFLALDAMWLSTMAPLLYRPALGPLVRENFDALAAIGFYASYVVGMVAFVVDPAQGRARAAATKGALFGFVAYATYDLTNQATLRGWPWTVTAADLCWGTVATACACAFASWITRAPQQ